jgi:hypothetical protein
LHSGSSSFRRRPIASGIHNFPVSVPLASSYIAAVYRLCPSLPFFLFLNNGYVII